MGLTARQTAAVMLVVGFATVVIGLALIYPPLALVAAGCGLGALGLEELRSR